MRNPLSMTAAFLLLAGNLFAGGIVTNTNQSAMYTRMANRDATLEIDAVYYNPAGLTQLNNGFHFSLNNQTIGQKRTVTSDYQYLKDGQYEGEVSAPFFPGVYAAFKAGKLAVSAGFNPIGGGGGATYDRGLPSFEYSVSDLVPALQSQGVTGYELDAFFEGSSVFFGYQANISYALTDMISISVGARYVTAKESYTGHLKGINLLFGEVATPATTFFNGAAAQYTSAATDLNSAGSALQPAIDAGAGGLELTDPTLVGTLQALGLYQPGMTNAQAQATFYGAATAATVSAAEATATATLLADQDVEAEKTGSGITPIVSVNVRPNERLNFAVKYEHITKLELTNKTPAGKGGMVSINPDGTPVYLFPDGEKSSMDMPAYLAIGASFRPVDRLLLTGGYHTFFDKNAVWGTEEDNNTDNLSSNSWELGLAAEYALGEKFLVSAGWLMTETGATEDYQSDMSYSLSTQGISFGGAWNIVPNVQMNLGVQLVSYQNGERNFKHDFANTGTLVDVKEELAKSVWVVGAGLNFSLARP